MAKAMIASQPLLCNLSFPVIKPFALTSPLSPFRFFRPQQPLLSPLISTPTPFSLSPNRRNCSLTRPAARKKPTFVDSADFSNEGNSDVRRLLQILLWGAEAVYILWLFLLPYAPGDPVWAISSETVNSLVGLSLNFFFVLPAMNSVGIRVIDAPVLHPMSEGLFNFVIAWTLMFAPLLFTDRKRDQYSGSLDLLWGLQMFLTNTFLIPYMAIRLNEASEYSAPQPQSKLGTLMTNGAPVVGVIGGAICIISIIWSFVGRADGNFGGVAERWEFLIQYLSSERLAYAFIWDICLYSVFQPWLIGGNLQNVKESKVGVVSSLRFVPVVGLIAYLLFLKLDEEL
ncbi:putative transmembrane protein [Cucumis melo var. makuwa]|uniref:Transmembrane protein n=2 Tax=Cucumis melo TaxID=3656 RepID=A0A5D3CZV8_CUCMM|nr:putative transmembrane protein [Cucumis melo var. makuwa]TYK15986.1 putative transmembrane protein [Cucumis melo var. makuwa]